MRQLLLLLTVTTLSFAAELSGKWSCEVNTDAGSGSPSFVFEQADGKLKGKYSGQLGEADVTGKVEGDKVSWSFVVSGADVIYEGSHADGQIKGKVDLAGQATGTFACKKQ